MRILLTVSIGICHLAISLQAGVTSKHAEQKTTTFADYQGRFENGIPRAQYNIGYKISGSSAEQTADAYLFTLRSFSKIADPSLDFSLERLESVPGGSHLRYQQTYRGIPVFRADVVISLDETNTIGMVINNVHSDVALESTEPSLSASSAAQIASAALNTDNREIGTRDAAELMIYPAEDGRNRLAYRVTMTRENPLGDWEVFVDAMTGEVLNREDLFVSFSERVQGSGYVYLTDPLSAARKFYNSAGFTDNSDADTDSLTYYRSLVTLDSLTLEDGLFKLRGPYVNVTDIESPADPTFFTAVMPDSFRYTRSQQEFEAVNVYYHATKSYRRLLELGFANETLAQLRIDPHGFQGQDNSHYSPTGNWIGMGEGGVDDAEDADVIWHEYGHAINYNLVPTWGGGESGSLGEGYGDYWAASYSRSLQQWQPGDMQLDWIFNWDGHNPFWMGRVDNDSRTYPFAGLPMHSAGQIWNAALMGIWGDLGRDITDRLVIKSLFYLGGNATAVDAANAILQADRDMYHGIHLQTLVHWLGTEKHFLVPENYLPTITHTPLTGEQDPLLPIEIRAAITSQTGLDLNQLNVIWGPRRFENMTQLVPTQNPNEFVAYLPPLGHADTVWYYLEATDVNGTRVKYPMNAPLSFNVVQVGSPASTITGVNLPVDFALKQNYPNPFNPTTSITYALPEISKVSLKIFDLLGREIVTLVDSDIAAGSHDVTWSGSNSYGMPVSSGLYYYRIEAQAVSGGNQFSEVRKMVLVR